MSLLQSRPERNRHSNALSKHGAQLKTLGNMLRGLVHLPSVSGSSNHYNKKLGKCIVDVQTVDKNGTAEFVLDAYEQSDIIWCNTRFTPKQATPMQRTCMDHQNKHIDPTEADKQIDALLKE